jgi:hypothetical protein
MPASFGWNTKDPHELRALAWLKDRWDEKRPIPTEELLEWDRTHGRHLFTWDDAEAGHEYRLQQARNFMGRFQMRLNGFRVRGWYNVREEPIGPEHDAPNRAYWPTTAVVDQPSLRAKVIQDVTRRLETQAATLRFLELTEDECELILDRVERALGKEMAVADGARTDAAAV